MVKTVSQIAREYGVAEQTIYKRIKRLSTVDNQFSAWVSTGDNGVMVIDDDGIAVLTKGLSRTVDNGTQQVDNDIDNGRQPVDNDVKVSNDTVDTLVAMLQRELEVKNKQIEDLTSALVAAQQTAAAAQALHAGTMKTQLLTNGEVKEDVTEVKTGWLKRIFSKK